MRERVPETAKTELDEAATNDELFLRRRTNSTSSLAVPKEITTDGVEFGRSYSKGDAAATTRRRHRKPDPRAVAAAHDAYHPPQLLHPRPSPTPRTPAPSRSRTRRLPPSAGAARAGPPRPQAPWRSPARRGSVPTASCRRGRRAEKLRRGKRSGHLATAEEEQKKQPSDAARRRILQRPSRPPDHLTPQIASG